MAESRSNRTDSDEATVLCRDLAQLGEQILVPADDPQERGVAVIVRVEQRLGDGEDALEQGAELGAMVYQAKARGEEISKRSARRPEALAEGVLDLDETVAEAGSAVRGRGG